MGPDKEQHGSWVTDLRVTKANGYTLMQGGRARWKSAKEPCHTLQNPGENVDHTSGHGAQHLWGVLATLRLLALLSAQTPPLWCAFLRALWEKRGSKRLLGERRRALCCEDAPQSMRQLLEALWDGVKKFAPQCAVDSSSCPKVFLVVRVTIAAICASAIVTGSVRLGNANGHFCHHTAPVSAMMPTLFDLGRGVHRLKSVWLQ